MDWSPGAITRTYISPSRNHILWTPCICTYLWVVGGHPTDLILSRLVGHPFFWRQDLRLPSRKSSWLNLRNSWMNRWEILSHATGPIGPMGPRSPMSPKKKSKRKGPKPQALRNGWGEGVMVQEGLKHCFFFEGIWSLVRWLYIFNDNVSLRVMMICHHLRKNDMVARRNECPQRPFYQFFRYQLKSWSEMMGFLGSWLQWNGWKVGLHGSSTASQKLMVSFGPPISCWKWLH